MIKTKPIRGKKLVSATFKVEMDSTPETVDVVGEFNSWSPGRHPMKRRKDGSWSATVRLPRNRHFQFRYLVDGQTWITDNESAALLPNEFGTLNALMET